MRNKPNRGSKGFSRIVDVRDGKPCKLKRHYRDCVREVVGYLDVLASNDEERFVYASVLDIVKHCKKRKKNNQPYGKRACEYALGLLARKDHLIIQQAVRLRKGAWRWGWLVAHHNTVAVREDGQCDFKGQHHWEREIKTERQPDGSWKLSSVGIVRWTDWTTGEVLRCAEQCAVKCAVENPKCAVKCAVSQTEIPLQPTEETGTSKACAPASLVSRGQSALGALQTQVLTTPVNLVNESTAMVASEKPLVGGVVEEKAKADDEIKTILQHFGGQWGVVALTIDEISAGTMVKEIWDEKVDYEVQRDLLNLCGEIILEFGAQTYLGPQTNARIMDSAAQRYNKQGRKYPPCWLKVLSDLKRSSNTPA